MGFRPISTYPISDLRADTFFLQETGTAFFLPGLLSDVSDVQAQAWRRMIIAADINVLPSPSIHFYAATNWFISRSTDVPANTEFVGALDAALRFDRSIEGGQNGYSGFSDNVSELTLINADGIYDSFAGALSVNGQPIKVSIGQTDDSGLVVAPYAMFAQVATFVGERYRVSRQALTIEMRDNSLPVVTETTQNNVYGGSGELDGPDALAGKRKPFLDGVVFNVTPTLVIPGELLYQLNDGALTSIDSVKDGGAALTLFQDYANVAALRAAGAALSIPRGFYGTSISDGYFLLGGAPAKQITADATGTHLKTADIITAILATVAGGPSLDTASFTRVNSIQPATVGYFLDSNATETCAETLTKLMTGIGGWWGIMPVGTLIIDVFTVPSSTQVLAFYNTQGGDMLDIDRTALPQSVDPPPHRRRVIYQRNYTVMTDIVGSVIETYPALADALRGPYQLATTSDARSNAVLAKYPSAPDPDPIESYFANQGDAQTEANRIFDLYSQGFSAFRFTLKNQVFVHQIGQVVNVTDSRLGLSGGKYLRLVSLSDDCATMQTEAIGFG